MVVVHIKYLLNTHSIHNRSIPYDISNTYQIHTVYTTGVYLVVVIHIKYLSNTHSIHKVYNSDIHRCMC